MGAAVSVARVARTFAARALAVVALLVCLADAGSAQMQLPGANNGNSSDSPSKPSGGGGGGGGPPPAPLKPVYIKPPSNETLIGRKLAHDGKSGAMTFEHSGPDLVLKALKLEGDKISKPQQTCTVDVEIASPVTAKSVGHPSGAERFDLPLAACPFTIDVLDGSVLVSRTEPSCEFKAADCRVTPGGLWGPAAADITPKQAKDLERQRPKIETTMRTNFRALLKKAGKDRAAVKAIAKEQAAFSSEREMTCRDYDKESVHGFCSTQITEARALALLAKFGPVDDKSADHKRSRPKKAKAAPSAEAPSPAAPGPEDAAQ